MPDFLLRVLLPPAMVLLVRALVEPTTPGGDGTPVEGSPVEGEIPSGRGDGNIAAISDFCADAFSVLMVQWASKPNLRSLLCSLVDPMTATDAAMAALRSLTLSGAVGDQLTRLGSVVGVDRGGRSDAALLAAIRVQILANRSGGTINEIIAIARAYLDDAALVVRLYNWGAKAYSVELDVTPAEPEALAAQLSAATDAAARAALLYSGVPVASRLEMGRTYGNAVANGMGSVTASGVGGVMSSYVVRG